MRATRGQGQALWRMPRAGSGRDGRAATGSIGAWILGCRQCATPMRGRARAGNIADDVRSVNRRGPLRSMMPDEPAPHATRYETLKAAIRGYLATHPAAADTLEG